jgi:hypothetical protein
LSKAIALGGGRGLRQEDHKFKASLSYTARLSNKKKRKKEERKEKARKEKEKRKHIPICKYMIVYESIPRSAEG